MLSWFEPGGVPSDKTVPRPDRPAQGSVAQSTDPVTLLPAFAGGEILALELTEC